MDVKKIQSLIEQVNPTQSVIDYFRSQTKDFDDEGERVVDIITHKHTAQIMSYTIEKYREYLINKKVSQKNMNRIIDDLIDIEFELRKDGYETRQGLPLQDWSMHDGNGNLKYKDKELGLLHREIAFEIQEIYGIVIDKFGTIWFKPDRRDMKNSMFMEVGGYVKLDRSGLEAIVRLSMSQQTESTLSRRDEHLIYSELLTLIKTRHSVEWDKYPYVLQFKNNILYDLEQRKPIKPKTDYFIKSIIHADYIEGAKCPIFDRYVKTTFVEGQEDKVDEMYSHAILAKKPKGKDIAYMITGPAGSGKGTSLEVISVLVGKENSLSITSPHTQLNDKPTLAKAVTCRAIFMFQCDIEELLKSEIFLSLSSPGDNIRVRDNWVKAKDVLDIETNSTCIISMDKEFDFDLEEYSRLTRRLHVLEVRGYKTDEERDPEIANLKYNDTELAGIIQRMLPKICDMIKADWEPIERLGIEDHNYNVEDTKLYTEEFLTDKHIVFDRFRKVEGDDFEMLSIKQIYKAYVAFISSKQCTPKTPDQLTTIIKRDKKWVKRGVKRDDGVTKGKPKRFYILKLQPHIKELLSEMGYDLYTTKTKQTIDREAEDITTSNKAPVSQDTKQPESPKIPPPGDDVEPPDDVIYGHVQTSDTDIPPEEDKITLEQINEEIKRKENDLKDPVLTDVDREYCYLTIKNLKKQKRELEPKPDFLTMSRDEKDLYDIHKEIELAEESLGEPGISLILRRGRRKDLEKLQEKEKEILQRINGSNNNEIEKLKKKIKDVESAILEAVEEKQDDDHIQGLRNALDQFGERLKELTGGG